MYRQRRRKLFDQTLVGDEDVGALEDRSVDEIPDDQAERDIGQVFGQRQFEQLRVQQPHRHRRRARRDRDPERAEHRAAVTLFDVLPAQVQPQFALVEAGDEVAPRAAHRPRLRGRVGERHCEGLSNFSRTAQAPQPNPLHQARRGHAAVTKKYQPNRAHSCGTSLRMPGCDWRYPRLR